MKFLVCISKAPDTTSKIDFTDNATKFNEAGIQYIINPYDEWYALVRALELKESSGGEVTIITVGPQADEPVMRKALAIGADKAVRINAEATDSGFVANQIADYAAKENFDIVLCGKETINYNSSQVPAMIAAHLDYPLISLATKLDINGSTATLQRDGAGGEETVEVQTPFVLSAAKGMAEQRIPNMKGIMAARTKPLEVIEPTGSDVHTQVVSYEMPSGKAECKYLEPDQMDQLVELLHTEAKVI